MAWIDLYELDPSTLEHHPVAHGASAESVQEVIDHVPSPSERLVELKLRYRAGIPMDTVVLGEEEFEHLVGTATDEQMKAMKTEIDQIEKTHKETGSAILRAA